MPGQAMQQPVPGGSTERGSTFGENQVGLTFNPSNDPQVQEVKVLCAKLIDMCDAIISQEPTYTEFNTMSHRGQLLQHAIREIITAQMWVVKGITYKN